MNNISDITTDSRNETNILNVIILIIKKNIFSITLLTSIDFLLLLQSNEITFR